MPFGRYQACEIIHTKVLDHQLFISFLIKNSFKEMKSKEHDHHLIIVTVQTKDKKQQEATSKIATVKKNMTASEPGCTSWHVERGDW